MRQDNVQRAIAYFSLAEKSDYIGESVSQLTHALQSAYFAEKSGHSEAVILASLFHDIGHYASHTEQFHMANLGIVNHEWIGAKLAYDLGFSAKVALLIGHHVNAKRYLAAKKENYLARLSQASLGTLSFQGGPMSNEEMVHFEKHPLFKEILQVRVNDEKAKEINLSVPDLSYYQPLITKHIAQHHHADNQNKIDLINFVDNEWVQNLQKTFKIE